MRIVQFARKYEVGAQEIISFLQETASNTALNPNSRLDDQTQSLVAEHFAITLVSAQSEVIHEPEEVTETSEEKVEETEELPEVEKTDEEETVSTPEAEIQPLTADLDASELEVLDSLGSLPDETELEEPIADTLEGQTGKDERHDPVENEQKTHGEDEVIQTDRLLDMIEAGEVTDELEKIKLIKAPKKELDGLKVVGKIDLPEPTKKESKEDSIEEKDEVNEADLRRAGYGRRSKPKRQPLSEEEKEKRRLNAKRKKEAYDAREEKRRKEQESKRRKAQKEAHYKQKLAQTKVAQSKQHRDQHLTQSKKNHTSDQQPKPKTVLGKFWRWLNT